MCKLLFLYIQYAYSAKHASFVSAWVVPCGYKTVKRLLNSTRWNLLRHCPLLQFQRPLRCIAVRVCGLLLRTSHVAWSVCLRAKHTDELCKTDEMPFGVRLVWIQWTFVRWKPSPHEKKRFYRVSLETRSEWVQRWVWVVRRRCAPSPNYVRHLFNHDTIPAIRSIW